MIVRALTRPALERFRDFLGRSRAGSVEEPPWVLLEDPAETTELPVTVEVGDERFGDRRSIGDHLCRMFSSMPSAELERNPGLWAWLSLYWFEQLCPRRKDGRRRPGNDLRHIPEFGRSRYHHLLYGPYHVYRQHGPRSVVLLSGPVQESSHLYHAITARQDLIANRSVIEAALLLYVERRTGRLKRGCQPSRPRPGTIRRYINVLQQLDLTFDIYGITGPQLLDLLPPEFDRWRFGD